MTDLPPAPNDLHRPEYFHQPGTELAGVQLPRPRGSDGPRSSRCSNACAFCPSSARTWTSFSRSASPGSSSRSKARAASSAPDHMTAAEIFAAASKRARELVAVQYRCWNEDLAPALCTRKTSSSTTWITLPPTAARVDGARFSARNCFPVADAAGGRSEPSLPPTAQQEPQPHRAAQTARRERNLRPPSCRFPRVLPRLLRIPEEAAARPGAGRALLLLAGPRPAPPRAGCSPGWKCARPTPSA